MEKITTEWSRPLLLSRFLLGAKVWGRSRAKTRANTIRFLFGALRRPSSGCSG